MDTFERLKKIFVDVFEDEIDISNVSADTRLKEDLGLKSISFLYLALAIEEEFGVKFTNEDIKDLVTVADVITKIEA